jgi:hypothetical protein
MHNAYPTGADLVAFFAACGYPAIDEEEGDGLIATAVGEWERLCRHSPFLADEDTLNFDVVTSASNDGYRLLIEENPIMANVAIEHTSASGATKDLVEGTDFDMLPMSAGKHLNPHFIIRFRSNLGSGTVAVTGQFGYATSIPEPVWDVIIDYAVALKLSRLQKAAAFGMSGRDTEKIKQGPVEITYARKEQSTIDTAREAMAKVSEGYL